MANSMKIVTVIGTRPQFVKAAVVSKALAVYPTIHEVLVHTDQHYDYLMSEIFFRELQIKEPNYHLNIRSAGHGVQTGMMMQALEPVLIDERPDMVLVYGDTNSTAAGALVAAKLHIPVVHIEAGLRSFNRAMPEEINRVITDHLSDLLCAPTESAVQNLAKEGIHSDKVALTGDVMYDAALTFYSEGRASLWLETLGVCTGEYVLVTIHRAENTDSAERLTAIYNELVRLSKFIKVVFPLHPRTKVALASLGFDLGTHQNLDCLEPLGYLDMLVAERNARCIVTDSGGVQREAYFAGVPSYIVRAETEWVELVTIGRARLVEPGAFASLVIDQQDLQESEDKRSLYGGGDAAITIAHLIATHQCRP
jgi:UDP-GlcNAc3NAcA epimerase